MDCFYPYKPHVAQYCRSGEIASNELLQDAVQQIASFHLCLANVRLLRQKSIVLVDIRCRRAVCLTNSSQNQNLTLDKMGDFLRH